MQRMPNRHAGRYVDVEKVNIANGRRKPPGRNVLFLMSVMVLLMYTRNVLHVFFRMAENENLGNT